MMMMMMFSQYSKKTEKTIRENRIFSFIHYSLILIIINMMMMINIESNDINR